VPANGRAAFLGNFCGTALPVQAGFQYRSWHIRCSSENDIPTRPDSASRRERKPEETMTPEPNRASEEALRRVQGEFLEMPGLRLTEAQARRLWGLDAASCDALLGALVDAKFLFKTRDGAFMRIEHAQPHKATMRRKSAAA
jgi:hypothetical protein